ncbi:helix-turn-helix domain-containing protein (plasmid) [Paracoccus sp. TD-10]|uniref:helix-turn-helix domain-containing protein n=1 Tax=Paracoccus sp. TD-10 TaxID=3395918 RepID=UPI003AB07BB1
MSTYVLAKTLPCLLEKCGFMGYQLWRSTWRLLCAVDLLASGRRVTEIASELDFASDSAFTTYFQQITGQTPRSHIQQMK